MKTKPSNIMNVESAEPSTQPQQERASHWKSIRQDAPFGAYAHVPYAWLNSIEGFDALAEKDEREAVARVVHDLRRRCNPDDPFDELSIRRMVVHWDKPIPRAHMEQHACDTGHVLIGAGMDMAQTTLFETHGLTVPMCALVEWDYLEELDALNVMVIAAVVDERGSHAPFCYANVRYRYEVPFAVQRMADIILAVRDEIVGRFEHCRSCQRAAAPLFPHKEGCLTFPRHPGGVTRVDLVVERWLTRAQPDVQAISEVGGTVPDAVAAS